MKHTLLTIAIMVFSFYHLNARILTSVANEDFTSSSAWSGGRTPASGDTLVISSGTTVTIDSKISYAGSLYIIVEGTLKIKSGGTSLSMGSNSMIDIRSGGILKTEGGGGGSSQTIKINGTTVWRKSDGNKTGPYMIDETGGFVPLPVTLLSFNVASVSNSVLITWSTSNEINNQYYTIEKSIDGGAFEKVTDLYTNFNTTSVTNYTYTDKEVNSNVVYRLSQTDMDTKLTYLASKSILSNTKAVSFNVWPNPATGGVLNINIPQSDEIYTIELYTLTGEKVYNAQMTSMNTEVNLGSDIAKGIYMLMLKSASGQTSNTKLMIQ